ELDELPREGQHKSCPLMLGPARSDLPELLEHRLLILRGNPHPGIGYRDLDYAVYDPPDHLNPATFRGELQGVRQEVQEHLLHLAFVPPHLTQALLHRSVQGEPPAAGALPDEREGVVDRLRKVEVR